MPHRDGNELRVFISSTFRDLQEEREHLIKKIFPEIRALCRQRGITFTEIDLRWGLTDEQSALGTVIRTCLEEVDKCRPYFIGIIGNRYGWAPELHEILMDPDLLAKYPWVEDVAIEGASITEMEFIHGAFDRPQIDGEYAFFYHRADDLSASDEPERLRSLLERVRDTGRPLRQFAAAEELGREVRDDLVRMIDSYWPQHQAPTPLELERRAHASFAASRIRAYIPNPIYLKEFTRWVGSRERGAGSRKVEGGEVSLPAVRSEADTATRRDDLMKQSGDRIVSDQSPLPDPEHSPTASRSPLPAPPSQRSGDPDVLIGKPLVIAGESGLGKSSLVAYLVEYYRKKNPSALVIEHYVGASQTSGTAISVMRHIVEEIRERFAIDEPIPSNEVELERGFANWLFRCEHLAAREGIEVLIVVDAVNQLNDAGRRMAWLPKTIPAGVRLMISTTPEETLDRLAERGWERLTVTALEDERVRQSIVVRYLGEFHKGITPEQLRLVIVDAKGSSPLYLRVVAEELRLHGEHETVDRLIRRYTDAADLLEVFERVLERMERDYGADTVRSLLEMIWSSRAGLSESELLELTGIGRLDLSRLLFALDYHLLHRDGMLGFFHDYLRRAVEKRYLLDADRRHHVRMQLARYFEGVDLTKRTALELLWQYRLNEGGESSSDIAARLASTLARTDVLVKLYQGETEFELLASWARLAERGYNPGEEYRRSVAAADQPNGIDRGEVLFAAAMTVVKLDQHDIARELNEQLAAWGKEHHVRWREARAYFNLGEDLWRRGRQIGAMEYYQKSLAIATEIGDRILESNLLGNIGLVHTDQGRYAEALEYHQRMLAISEELGDRRGRAIAIGNIGFVYHYQGRYAEALELYGRQVSLAEEIGDRSRVSQAIGHMGIVHYLQGRYAEALECFGYQRSVSEELGRQLNVSTAICNMGMTYVKQGRYSEALECYSYCVPIAEEHGDLDGLSTLIGGIASVHAYRGEYLQSLEFYDRQRVICEEIGDPRGTSIAIGNMGIQLAEHGQYERSLEHFMRAAEGHRTIGYRYGLTYWLEGIARVLVTLIEEADASGDGRMPEYLSNYLHGATPETWRGMALSLARQDAEECIAMSDDLSKPDTRLFGRITLARVDVADGRRVVALEHLDALLADATDDETRADVHYWVWKIGDQASEIGNREEALRLYTQVIASNPKHLYKQRIEELTAP